MIIQVESTAKEPQVRDREFQRRGESRGFGAEETYVFSLERMVQLELTKKVNKGIPGRGNSKNRTNVSRRGREKLWCFYGIIQFDMKGCRGKEPWKCRRGKLLKGLKGQLRNLDFVGSREILSSGDHRLLQDPSGPRV